VFAENLSESLCVSVFILVSFLFVCVPSVTFTLYSWDIPSLFLCLCLSLSLCLCLSVFLRLCLCLSVCLSVLSRYPSHFKHLEGNFIRLKKKEKGWKNKKNSLFIKHTSLSRNSVSFNTVETYLAHIVYFTGGTQEIYYYQAVLKGDQWRFLTRRTESASWRRSLRYWNSRT